MKKKKTKTKLFMSLSVLIIVFLLSVSYLNVVSTEAKLDTNENQYNIDSFDRTEWKWNMTEVVSTESTENIYYSVLDVDIYGNVYVAWEDFTNYDGSGTDIDILYKYWDASSGSWSTTEVISTVSTTNSRNPSLAVDSSGNVHIVWEDDEFPDIDIFYRIWEDSTSTWTLTEIVSTESTGQSYSPSLAIDSSDNVHIAWSDRTDYAGAGTDSDIFYKCWNASSSSWTTSEVVSTESTSASWSPTLVVDSSGNVHIAWVDTTDYLGSGFDEEDIFYKSWNASLSSWTITELVSAESTEGSEDPKIAVDGMGNAHIVWYDLTDYAGAGSDIDIFYKSWNASTSSWTTLEIISTEGTGTSNYPSVAVDSANTIHFTWEDKANYAGAGSDYDIFYKRYDASPSLWSTIEVISTESTSDSQYSSVAVDTLGHIHVIWQDETDYAGAGTDPDIFYKLFAGPPIGLPELAFILPNPTNLTTIFLNWNDIDRATFYDIYRSTSYIWSTEELNPITTVASSEYIDTLPSEDFYYYAVVAYNFVGSSSISNCRYVEVKFPDLEAPELAPILPNPTEISSISLLWDSIDGAIEYYIYRSAAYIWSVEGLTPIDTVFTTSYYDSLPSEGYYFYVIVANDGERNSTHSNCEYVEYNLPTLHEFIIVTSLIIGIPVFLFVATRIRKKKSKQN